MTRTSVAWCSAAVAGVLSVALSLAQPVLASAQGSQGAQPAVLPVEDALRLVVDELPTRVPGEGRPFRAAVFEFTDLSGCRSALGRYLAEELVTRVMDRRRFPVLERSLLYQTMDELRLNLSDLFDPAQAQRFRHQIGAEAVLTGKYADAGATLTLYVRLIHVVGGGQILGAVSVKVTKDPTLARYLTQAVTCPPGTLEKRDQAHENTGVISEPGEHPLRPLGAYKSESFRMTILSARKAADTVTVVGYLEARTKKPYQLELAMSDGEMYLLDDRGLRWELDRRRVGGIRVEIFAIWFTGRVELVPDTRVAFSLTFQTAGDSDGRTFTLVGAEGMGGSGGAGSPALFGQGRRIVIKGLKAEEQP